MIEKLLVNHIPIDRVAMRVVKKAKPEALWAPNIRKDNRVFSSEALATRKIPQEALRNKPELAELPGRRRGRMTIIGYAANQGGGKQGAKWVVRCDCGNYEHRRSIFRWLGTDDDDMCWVCLSKRRKIKKPHPPKSPAKRSTVGAA